jgi:hypothetical protein
MAPKSRLERTDRSRGATRWMMGYGGAILLVLAALADRASAQSVLDAKNPLSIWEDAVGSGLRAGTKSASLSLGAHFGVPMLGGRESHDLALASLSLGRIWGSVRGREHWYRGNWEFRGELFAGSEYSPETEWVIGLTPHLRYNFATGTRWMPFIDLGAGVTATSIGPPDLSGIFEFNLQACVGTHWFLRPNLALTFEGRYLHLSCARLSDPNLGLNGAAGFIGLSYFF